MSSPRLGYQTSINNHHSRQKLHDLNQYEGGGTTYNIKPMYDEIQQEHYYTNPQIRKNTGITISKGLMKIKNLKGMVDSIILDKKSDTINCIEQMQILKTHQDEVIDQIYNLKKSHTALSNYNSVKNHKN